MIDDTIITRLRFYDPNSLWEDTDVENKWKVLPLGKDEFLLSIKMIFFGNRLNGDILFLHKVIAENEHNSSEENLKSTVNNNLIKEKDINLKKNQPKQDNLINSYIHDIKEKLSQHKETLSGELIVMMKNANQGQNLYVSLLEDLEVNFIKEDNDDDLF